MNKILPIYKRFAGSIKHISMMLEKMIYPQKAKIKEKKKVTELTIEMNK